MAQANRGDLDQKLVAARFADLNLLEPEWSVPRFDDRGGYLHARPLP
jgi:hypothetical protein